MNTPVIEQLRAELLTLDEAAQINGVLRMLEGDVGRCRHCGAPSIVRFGKALSGRQRWRCRACRRTFSTFTATVLEGIHDPGKFARLVVDMLIGGKLSCRRLGLLLGADRMTVWHWRRKVMGLLQRFAAVQSVTRRVTATIIVRESRKASREWVNHRRDPARFPKPDRRRWVDYRRLGLPPPTWLPKFRVPVTVVEDDGGHCRAAVLPGGRNDIVSPYAVVNRARPPHAVSPAETAAEPRIAPARRMPIHDRPIPGPPGSDKEAIHLIAEWRSFLGRFCGPATRHLDGYAAWFACRKSRLPSS